MLEEETTQTTRCHVTNFIAAFARKKQVQEFTFSQQGVCGEGEKDADFCSKTASKPQAVLPLLSPRPPPPAGLQI